jgi:hypothetical protein
MRVVRRRLAGVFAPRVVSRVVACDTQVVRASLSCCSARRARCFARAVRARHCLGSVAYFVLRVVARVIKLFSLMITHVN